MGKVQPLVSMDSEFGFLDVKKIFEGAGKKLKIISNLE